MKIHYTEESLASLRESLFFLSEKLTPKRIEETRIKIFDRAEKLVQNPNVGQKEEYLAHLKLGHKRIIEGHYKIVYRIEKETIYITDIFDTRQDPEKIKG